MPRAGRIGRFAALVFGAAICVVAVLTPGPEGICERLFALAKDSGGAEAQAATRIDVSQCQASYEKRRQGRGYLRFARLSWCVAFANTLGEAGRC